MNLDDLQTACEVAIGTLAKAGSSLCDDENALKNVFLETWHKESRFIKNRQLKDYAWRIFNNVFVRQDELSKCLDKNLGVHWRDDVNSGTINAILVGLWINLQKSGLESQTSFVMPEADLPEAVSSTLQEALFNYAYVLILDVLSGFKNDEITESSAERQLEEKLQAYAIHPESIFAAFVKKTGNGVLINMQMLDDVLDRFLYHARFFNISENERWILRLGLYGILTDSLNSAIVLKICRRMAGEQGFKRLKNFMGGYLEIAAKSKARELAFQTLYGLSFTPVNNMQELKNFYNSSPHNPIYPHKAENGEPCGYAWQLITGVWNNGKDLDDALARFSRNWRLERIGKVELMLLRLGLYEILNNLTPPKVVMSEILDLAVMFGVQDARSFINGILDAAARSTDSGFGA